MTTTHKIERKIHISEIEELYEKLNNPKDPSTLGDVKFHTDMWYDFDGQIDLGERTYVFVFISNNEKSEKEIILLSFETNNDGLISSVTYDGNSNFFINDKFINLLNSGYEGLDHKISKDLYQWLGMGEYHFDFEMGHKLDTSTVLKRTPIKL